MISLICYIRIALLQQQILILKLARCFEMQYVTFTGNTCSSNFPLNKSSLWLSPAVQNDQQLQLDSNFPCAKGSCLLETRPDTEITRKEK